MQPEELSESEFIEENEARDCDENDDVSKKVTKKFHTKGTLGNISQHCRCKGENIGSW